MNNTIILPANPDIILKVLHIEFVALKISHNSYQGFFTIPKDNDMVLTIGIALNTSELQLVLTILISTSSISALEKLLESFFSTKHIRTSGSKDDSIT